MGKHTQPSSYKSFPYAFIWKYRAFHNVLHDYKMVGRTVYVPPLPRDLADLNARITAAVKNIDAPMLMRVART
jgi:hypothetical protein